MIDLKYMENPGHERNLLSDITRERDMILRNTTRITNRIHGDLAVVFPEFTDVLAIDSAAGIAVLEEYAAPEKIAMTDPQCLLKLMRKAGRNHYTMKDVEKVIQAAKTTIGIPRCRWCLCPQDKDKCKKAQE